MGEFRQPDGSITTAATVNPMTQPELERLAASLSEAQRDTIMGHIVEIPPEEYEQLIELGLKEPPKVERVVYNHTYWPITETGLALRNHLQAQEREG